jgi:LysM repeat protein/ABC-type branched-subunit amino acid transport system substrate-binding protein
LKKYLIILWIALLSGISLLPAAGQFQPTEVVRSREKTLVNGKMYYIHTVQKGQTLYSISKAYEVSQDLIRQENPNVDPAALKEGLVLRIPVQSGGVAPVYPQNRDDFYDHKVKKGQTVYSLAKKYDVEEELIYQYNPWARQGIQPDQTVWIPKRKEMQSSLPAEQASSGFYYHTVKEKETLYSISLLYNIAEPELVEQNPSLKDGLKAGQVLRIPQKAATTAEPEPEVPSAPLYRGPCDGGTVENKTWEVALILPLYAKEGTEEPVMSADSLSDEGGGSPGQRQAGLKGRNFAEFYEGFLLAADSLKQSGLSLNIRVYDAERDEAKIRKILQDVSDVHPDLIIGPVFSEEVNLAGRLAVFQEVNMVSPLSTRASLVAHNPRVFQVVPSRDTEKEKLASYLAGVKKGRIVLIRGTDSVSVRESWKFKKYFLEHRPVDELGRPLEFADFRLNDSLLTHIGHVLSQHGENHVVVISESEPDVSRLITKLYMMAPLYPMEVYGMPSWQAWKTIDLNYFHSLGLHLISPFFVDYTKPEIRRFMYRCRETYGYEPYETGNLGYNFGMLGYDVGLYFLSAIRQYGRDFQTCLDNLQPALLLAPYKFVKMGDGGYVNSGFSIISYNKDYTVSCTAIE